MCDHRQVAAAQAALKRGESGAAERLAAAEEELERALEAVLDAECAGGGGFGGKVGRSKAHVHTYIGTSGFRRSAAGVIDGNSNEENTRVRAMYQKTFDLSMKRG